MTDFRKLQTPVRRQGNRPTCVGFAVSAAHEWDAGHGNGWMSPEDAIWAGHTAGGDPGREATSVQYALTGLAANRQAIESSWPYGNPPWPAPRPGAAQAAANQRALPAWRRLATAQLAAVAKALETPQPVVLTLRFVPFAWHPGPIVDADKGAKVKGNHAVLACGIEAATADEGARVLIKNSWGETWGNGGYGLVTERYLTYFGLCAHALEGS